MHRSVIGRVESLPLEAVDQHGPSAVVLAPAHSPSIVFHGDESALVVTSVTIRIARLGLKDAHVTVVLRPSQDAMIRNVAPQQAAPVSHPDRTLIPQRRVVPTAMPNALQRRVALLRGKTLVHDFPRGLGIGDRRVASPVAIPPELVRGRGDARCCCYRRRRGTNG